MFSSKEAEAVNKAQMVRRLSMLTFWSNYDGLRMHLPLLQERLVDLIRVYHGLVLGEVKCDCYYMTSSFLGIFTCPRDAPAFA